jgi:hypothetical protein
MSINLSPLGGAGWQFFDNNGVPLAGGLLYTYQAGTTTPIATYTTSSGSISNSNPIVLDSSGRPTNEIWLNGNYSYKFVLTTATGSQIWSMDNLGGGFPSAGTESYVTVTSGLGIYPSATVITGLTYTTGNNSLKVFVNGSKQIVSVNYNETNSTTVTFPSGLNVGDVVEFLQ